MEIPSDLLIKKSTSTTTSSFFLLGDQVKSLINSPSSRFEENAQNIIIKSLNSLFYTTDGKTIKICLITIYTLVALIFVILAGMGIKYYLRWRKKNAKNDCGHEKLNDQFTPGFESTFASAPPKYDNECN